MLENMAQVQNYAYLLVSLKQISFVLFTYSMSRKSVGTYMYLNSYRRYREMVKKSGNHERGCTSKHFRVPTLLSILQNAPLPKNTESGSSKQATQLSPRAALPALCFTSTYLSKYGSFSCKSMCIDIYRRQLRWSSPSVNWSVIRMQFFLQAQSSVCKPSD